MTTPNYSYTPLQAYQWSNGDADEARNGREDGFAGTNMTTAHISRFNDHVVLIGRPFSDESLISRPDNLAYQPDQRNFITDQSNPYETYGYSRLGPSSLAVAPPTSTAERYVSHHHSQPTTSGAEYEGPGSYPHIDYSQYRDYGPPSESTAEQLQQQLLQPSRTPSTGPLRKWRAKLKPKVDSAELARIHAPLALSTEERRRALRLQFQAQHGASSPVTPTSTTSSLCSNGGTRPAETPGYPQDISSGWPERDMNAERQQQQQQIPPSTLAYVGTSPSSSEQASSRQPAHVHAHACLTLSTSSSNASATTSASADSSSNATTVFIHSNLTNTNTSTPATNTVHDYPDLVTHFPLQTEAHRKLRVAMHAVLSSEWKRRNELEPTSLEILQFSTRVLGDGMTEGEESKSFKYRCLLYHNGTECKGRWARAERMLAHLRSAIDLRPFACEGEGDVCNCGLRFFAEDTLQQHRKNATAVSCTNCGAGVTPRNMKRHLQNNCPKRTQI